jgi:hypothetical protein
MKAYLHIFAAVVLLTGGLLAGRAITSSTVRPSDDTGSMVDRLRENGAAAERGQLARLRAAVDRVDSVDVLRPGMEKLGIAELEALAREQMEKGREAGRWSDHRTVADAALEELYRREGADALERVSRWPEPLDVDEAISVIMLLHISADWESAISLLEKFPEPLDPSVLAAAMKKAAGRSADDFLRVAALTPERDRLNPFSNWQAFDEPMEFAAGFDFGRVYASRGMDDMDVYLKEWGIRQPDAAWDAMSRALSAADQLGWPNVTGNLSILVDGVVRKDGELAGMDWLGGKVAALPPEVRAGLFTSGMFDIFVSGEAHLRFFAHLEPSDVSDFIGAQIHFSENVFYPAMEQLPREELIPLLGQLALKPTWTNLDAGAATRLQQRFSLTPDEVQRIKLATPE